MSSIKILVLGGKQSGKSSIANFLSNLDDIAGKKYIPTRALRICQFSREIKGQTVDINLYDVSGDKQYNNCWPAIAQDADGILFVYDPDMQQGEKDLQFWHDTFTKRLISKQCLIFAHRKNGELSSVPTLRNLNRIKIITTCLNTPQDKYRHAFDSFVEDVLLIKQEKEEKRLLQ